MEVRPARASDHAEVGRLCGRSVRGLGRRAYSDAQIEVWAQKVEARDHAADAAAGAFYLVADVGDGSGRLAGVTALFGDEIHVLYVDPAYAGQGLARRLTDSLERVARSCALAELRVTASRLARPFYEQRGYQVVRSKDREIDGVAFEVFEMRRRLRPRTPPAAGITSSQ